MTNYTTWIELARLSRGLARWELARKVKVTTAEIKLAEETGLSTGPLLPAIAEALGYPVAFFTRPPPEFTVKITQTGDTFDAEVIPCEPAKPKLRP